MFYKLLITLLLIAVVFILGMLVPGCSSRSCSYRVYDPNGSLVAEANYDTCQFCTETDVDDLKVLVPGKVLIEFNRFNQDNDAMRIVTPYVIGETHE